MARPCLRLSDPHSLMPRDGRQLPLSTWLVAPTSRSARAASFRREVEIGGMHTRVLAEQAAAVDPGRLGKSVGFLSFDEIRRVDAALRIVRDL
ncbi:hypothetical protein LAUMK42_02962 [Mycobacterium persicum]|uniref:Growth inhibitor PemK n=2 Tax=Mycobacterium persicum TaxID=1487726 RepID=A0AB38UTW9_9MYCO|nr:hypothetical protein B1T49_01475 [Mycobacterium persicum]VAZ84143.1 hypothetical protein LAUMK42_02962 [Mycobacterium persicum]